MHATFFPAYRPPAGRRAPDELQELLRDVDPTAELLYGGAGVWLLGKYRPNRDIRKRAEGSIARLEVSLGKAAQGRISIPPKVKREIAFRFWWWHLIRMGFRPVSRYPQEPGERIHGEPGTWIVEDFRKRQWIADHDRGRALQEREEEYDQEPREQAAQDRLRTYLEEMASDIHRHAFRTPIISTPKGKHHGKATANAVR